MNNFEPCEVEARFLRDGRPVPYKIIWRGQPHNIIEVGRFWNSGQAHHVLVKIPGQTLELCYQGSWSGKIAGKPRFSSL